MNNMVPGGSDKPGEKPVPETLRPNSGGQMPSRRGGRVKSLMRRFQSFDQIAAMADQGGLALIRLVGFLVFARVMTKEDFGAFALVVSMSFLLNNAQRSLVILPFIISCKSPEDLDREGADWFWIDLLVGATFSLVLLAGWGIALLFDGAFWLRTALFYAAIGTPALMAYTFLRRWAYQAQNYRNVLTMVMAYIIGYGAGIAFAVIERDIKALPFVAFVLAPVSGLIVGVLLERHRWRAPIKGLLGRWRKTLGFSTWSFLSFLVGSIYTNGMNIIVAGVVGAIGSAVFAATRTIVAPVVTLISAIDMIDKPRAGRAYLKDGASGLRESIQSTLTALLLLGTPYLILVFIFGDLILEICYRNKYASMVPELRIWAVAMFFQMVANPLSTHLIILADSRRVFMANLAGALATVGVMTVTIHPFGVSGALAAMTVGRVINVFLLFIMTRRIKPGKGNGEGSGPMINLIE